MKATNLCLLVHRISHMGPDRELFLEIGRQIAWAIEGNRDSWKNDNPR